MLCGQGFIEDFFPYFKLFFPLTLYPIKAEKKCNKVGEYKTKIKHLRYHCYGALSDKTRNNQKFIA